MPSPVGAAPLDLAVSLYQQGRVVDATLQASRRLCLAPDDGYGWLLLGNFSYAQRDLSLSRVAFEHAIQVTPSAPEAVFNLGNLYFRSGN